mgnify:CR=1 FL=1
MNVTDIRFIIERCNTKNDPNKQCHQPDDIDNFINDVQVDSWFMFEKMDFGVYDTKPVFIIQEIRTSEILDTSNFFKINMFLLRKHHIKTQDNFV